MFESIGLSKGSGIPESIYDMPWNEWYMVYGGIVLVFNTVQRYTLSPDPAPTCYPRISPGADEPSSALNVMQHRRTKNLDPVAPLYGLLPYFATWALVPLYLYLQPVILHHHLIPFVFYIGLINAYSVGQIITKHLIKDTEFPMYNILTLPLALAVVDSVGPMVGVGSALGGGTYQIAFLFCCVGLGVGVYGSFVVSRTSTSSLPCLLPLLSFAVTYHTSPTGPSFLLLVFRAILLFYCSRMEIHVRIPRLTRSWCTVRYYNHNLRLPGHLVSNDQTPIQRKQRAEKDLLKVWPSICSNHSPKFLKQKRGGYRSSALLSALLFSGHGTVRLASRFVL